MVCDIDADLAASTATEAERRGGRARVLALDVTDVAAVREAASAESRLDHVITCAETARSGAVAEIEDGDWVIPFALNVNGAMHIARAVHPLLAKSSASSVVNIGLTCGTSAYPGGGGGDYMTDDLSLARAVALPPAASDGQRADRGGARGCGHPSRVLARNGLPP